VVQLNNKLSVIIPNFNHARFLDKRLTSILNQRKYIDKIIILDDASEDSSIEIINKYRSEDVEVIVNNENSGSVFKQWEKGLSYVAPESLVWIAESDDVAHDHFLKDVLKVFIDPEVILAYTRSIDIDENGVQIGLSYKNLKWTNSSFVKSGKQEIEDHLYKQCTIPNVSAVVFRKKYVDGSFFNHPFKLCGDWYFYIRMLENGKIVYLNKALNYHRFHNSTVRNMSVKSLEVLNERLLIVNEVRNRYNLTFYRYVLSIYFQIDLYISETKITDLIGGVAVKMFKVINQHGFFFKIVSILLICKRLLKRLFSNP
jgi:glycosyltransferase involved in cell wall biosynthesis